MTDRIVAIRAQNGRKVTADMKYKILEEQDVYTLLILEPSAADSGSYECVSINKNGEARCQGQVRIRRLTYAYRWYTGSLCLSEYCLSLRRSNVNAEVNP